MRFYYIHGDAVSPLEGGTDFGAMSSVNPLAAGATLPAAQSQRLILWSGWCGDSIFERDFRTWTPQAWKTLDQFLRSFDSAGNPRLCFRPHPRHLLADPQSCLTFLIRYPVVQVLLDPAGFLTRSMLPRAEEHILRALDALADHAQVPAVLVSNVKHSVADDDLLEPAPVDHGLLPASLLRLIASRAGAKPILLLGDDPASQARFLNAPG